MAKDIDHITSLEGHIHSILSERLPRLLPGNNAPAVIDYYGGEFGTDDIIGTLDEMVSRGTHVLVSYMGGGERKNGNTGRVSEGEVAFALYIAGRNLRGEKEQRRDIYPVIQASRVVLRMAQDTVLTGSMGDAAWKLKVENIWPGDDSIVASVPGVACMQLELTADLTVLWEYPDDLT